MTCTTVTSDRSSNAAERSAAGALPVGRLPVSGLLALAMASFITVLTEALPAGLLPQMSVDLAVSEALVGQLVTLYAIGTLVTAIPLTVATQAWRRRPLLLLAIGGFAVVNTVTAVSTSYALTLGARFFAGVFAGLLWALVAGYAARMVAEEFKGRAIAIAMVGIPLALSLGIPAGTFIGNAVGWRMTFGIMSGLTVILIGWVIAKVPDFPGQPAGSRLSFAKVLAIPGVRSVLFVTFAFVLAHNVLYTYIAPFVVLAGIADKIDAVLLVFGVASLVSIWIAGTLIDRRLRELVLTSISLFAVISIALGLWSGLPAVVFSAAAIWGLAYGGVPTLFQTASAKVAGDAADVAQSMIVTVWNIGIAGGGLIGGVVYETAGAIALPWTLVVLLMPTFVVAWAAKAHGFPVAPKTKR